jgi:mono/diheme cytochrome c family protein
MKTQPPAVIAVLLGTMAALSPAHAQEGDSREGLVVAQQLCATCHAIRRGAAASPNSKAPTFETIAAVPGMTALALSVALRTSHKEMPNIILDAEQRANIVAYILSLRAK